MDAVTPVSASTAVIARTVMDAITCAKNNIAYTTNNTQKKNMM
jgi:hypothetical protein